MDEKELEKYQKNLKELKSKLEQELHDTPEIINFGDQGGHEEDEADESVAADEQAGIRDEIKCRLSSVDVALNKINTKDYGLCEECKEPIEEIILNIAPESRLCRNHKLKD